MIFSLAFHLDSVESNTRITGEKKMNRITMLLKSSDVLAVRKAVFAAGASRVVVSPTPKHAWAADFQDWYFGKQDSWSDAPVQVDVTVDENHADGIVSAFLKTAHVGKIERITRSSSKAKGIFPALLQAA